jgi:acetyl esterase
MLEGDASSLEHMAEVDPQARLLLQRWSTPDLATHPKWTADKVRRDDAAILDVQAAPMPMHDVYDVAVPGAADKLIARVYIPRGSVSRSVLYLHGRGFVIGPDGYDEPLRRLATESGARVVALHQRLAPEHPFPAALEDSLLAVRWLYDQWSASGGTEPLPGVIGDSSGGTLAAVVAQQLTAERIPLAFQVLIYPMLDALATSQSYVEFGTGYGFTREKSLWYFDQYVPPGLDRSDPRVSPLYQQDLHRLPRTLVITAECDPLRDEAVGYAHKLQRQGNQVEHWSYRGMIHGFFQMTGALDASRRLHAELGAWIASQ